jgi:calnexin
VKASASKYNGEWSLAAPTDVVGIPGDTGLLVTAPARHYGISSKFPSVLDPTGKGFVLQYEVRLQNSLTCGGAYLKVLTEVPNFNLKDLVDSTPYTVMFGPDKCGSDNKVHFIFRHQNPITKAFEEKHLKEPPTIKSDTLTHLYKLVVRPDNTFEIFIDEESVRSGSLLQDFNPPVNPPKEIDDPEDKKPADWVDEAKIPDPQATKPDDWDESEPKDIEDMDAVKPAEWLDDEPLLIPDPKAEKPAGWDEEEDGDWVAPTIENPKCAALGCGEWTRPMKANPKYKGKWRPPMIDNPRYKGTWAPRKIPNPNFYEDLQPANLNKMGAVAIEIWTMSENILFDNILVTQDKAVADSIAEATWRQKYNAEKALQDAKDGSKQSFDYNDLLQQLFNDPLELVASNPLIAVAISVTLTILIICCVCCCMGAPSGPKIDPAKKQGGEPQADVKPEVVQKKKEKKEKKDTKPEEKKDDTKEGDGASTSSPSSTKRKGRTPKVDQ